MANASPCLTVSNVSWWQEGLWPWERKGGENGRRLGHWVSQGVWGLGRVAARLAMMLDLRTYSSLHFPGPSNQCLTTGALS